MLKKYLAILLAAPVIIQSWHTYTATRDTVSLWLYDYAYMIKENSKQTQQTVDNPQSKSGVSARFSEEDLIFLGKASGKYIVKNRKTGVVFFVQKSFANCTITDGQIRCR